MAGKSINIFKAAAQTSLQTFDASDPATLRAVRDQLLSEVQELEGRAHACGLLVTARALNNAKNAIGWEIAGDVVMAGKVARGKREDDKE